MGHIGKPKPIEWDMSRLSEKRLAYLNLDLSFEQIASRFLDEAKIADVRIKGLQKPIPDVQRGTRQIIFLIRVGSEVSDLLYNAPEGLRARYWQSPDEGFLATRKLIDAFSDKLLSFANQHQPDPPENAAPMDIQDIRASLEASSAKIWPREMDGTKWFLEEQELVVPRWRDNEKERNSKGTSWREIPTIPELEIKGALLGPDGIQYWPPEKRDRPRQIHHYGFT